MNPPLLEGETQTQARVGRRDTNPALGPQVVEGPAVSLEEAARPVGHSCLQHLLGWAAGLFERQGWLEGGQVCR